MAAKIEEIRLPESLSENFSADSPFNSLRGIKRLNVLIGPNNSGKSRLLRALFKCKDSMLVSTSDETSSSIRTKIRKLIDLIPNLKDEASQLEDVLSEIEQALDGVSFSFGALKEIGNMQGLRQETTSKLGEIANKLRNDHRIRQPPDLRGKFTNVQSELNNIVSLTGQLSQSSQNQYRHSNNPPPEPYYKSAQFVYVPTLRGMRVPFDRDESKFTYFDRTITDYFPELIKDSHGQPLERARSQYSGQEIVTGLDLFELVSDRLLGSLSDRRFIREFETFLSKSFFDSKPIALIPRKGSDTLHIKIGDEVERPVEELGDGIQQIIILTLPIFLYRDRPLFLFIEEPDLFLHPGFQQVLIDLITDNDNQDFYAFVTTHSPQFVDVTLDDTVCAIFRCEKTLESAVKTEFGEITAQFRVKNVGRGDHSILRHVGVRPSSLMFANCTIWVEGVTDRLYFRKYIEMELKRRGLKYFENLHYAFVEYGGGNITHWSFLDDDGMDVDRICARLFLICDQDEGKETRHQKLETALGDRFYKLQVKEVENLLTPKIITAVIRDYEGENFELNTFNQSAYANRYLGRFIDKEVLPDKTQSARYGKLGTCYEDKSGTVKAKGEFCRRAVANMNSIEDMGEEAMKLAGRLCEFIAEQNRV